MSKYTVQSAIDQIVRCGGTVGDKSIRISNPGIRAWGAIDYLRRHGYSYSSG